MITMPGVQHLQSVAGMCWLIELQFTSGTLRLTTAPVNVPAAGYTWTGLGAVLDVQPVTESADAGTEQLEISLSLVDLAMLALTLGSVEGYRGKRVRMWLQLMTPEYQPVDEPVLRWAGFMEPIKVDRGRAGADLGDDEPRGAIVLPCSRAGLARSRNAPGARLTHAQQQADYPGDTGLRYVRQLVEQPALWLSKKFQAQ